MQHTYYTTCPYCGAHLDPGERCDCPRASPGGYPSENRTSTETGQVRKPDGCKKMHPCKKCTGADYIPQLARPAGDRVLPQQAAVRLWLKMTPGKLPGIPVAFYNRLHFATAAQQQKESRSHCWRSVGGRWAVKFSRQYHPHYNKNGGFYNDYVSIPVCCPVFCVVPDRCCGVLEKWVTLRGGTFL